MSLPAASYRVEIFRTVAFEDDAFHLVRISSPSSPPSVLKISSSDGGDTSQKVEVIGYDGTTIISEEVSLNGTTVVQTSNSYVKILGVYLDGETSGSVTIRDSADNILCTIPAGTTSYPNAVCGWHLSSGSASTDGDVLTLNGTIYQDDNLEFSSDSYPVVAVRVTDPGQWTLEIETSGDSSWTTVIEDNTESGLITASLPSGQTIYKVRITASSETKFDYIVFCGEVMTVSDVMEVRVDIGLSGRNNAAQLVLDNHSGEYNEISYGDMVKIWLSSGSVYYKKFSGYVTKCLRKSLRSSYTVELDCVGHMKLLKDRTSTFSIYNEYIHTAFYKILGDMLLAGVITPMNIERSSHTCTINDGAIVENGGVLPYINQVISSNQSDVVYDFYIDLGKDLHLFEAGSRYSGISIDEDQILESSYDPGKIINSVILICPNIVTWPPAKGSWLGRSEKTRGWVLRSFHDDSWDLNMLEIIEDFNLKSEEQDPSEEAYDRLFQAYISGAQSGSGFFELEFDFGTPDGEAISLSGYVQLHFKTYVPSGVTTNIDSYQVRLYDSSKTSYFYRSFNPESERDTWKSWTWDIGSGSSGWSQSGSPDWSSLRYFAIYASYSAGTESKDVRLCLYVDDLHFKKGYEIYTKENSSSIATYGRHVARIIAEDVRDYYEQDSRAQEILDAFSTPKPSFQVEIVPNLDINIGESLNISISPSGISGTYRVTSITYEMRTGSFRMSMTLGTSKEHPDVSLTGLQSGVIPTKREIRDIKLERWGTWSWRRPIQAVIR